MGSQFHLSVEMCVAHTILATGEHLGYVAHSPLLLTPEQADRLILVFAGMNETLHKMESVNETNRSGNLCIKWVRCLSSDRQEHL